MATAAADSLAGLYLDDETAWLEKMADLVQRGKFDELDLDNLAEYLSDMAKRDRREVKSRLVVLLVHLLKWEYQKDKRTRSWRTTILDQRQELADLARQGVLRQHAEAVLPETYERAVELAASETAQPRSSFPANCPYSIEQLLAIDLPQGDVE